MHIVAIAWLYVTLLMALTETNVTAGLLTFSFFGIAPLGLLLWMSAKLGRRRTRRPLTARADPGPGSSGPANRDIAPGHSNPSDVRPDGSNIDLPGT